MPGKDAVIQSGLDQLGQLVAQTKEITPPKDIKEVAGGAIDMATAASKQYQAKWTELDGWAKNMNQPAFTMELANCSTVANPAIQKIELRLSGQEMLIHVNRPSDPDALQFLRMNPSQMSAEDKKGIQESMGKVSGEKLSPQANALKYAMENSADSDYWVPWRADSTGIRWGNPFADEKLAELFTTAEKKGIEATGTVFDRVKVQEMIGMGQVTQEKIGENIAKSITQWGETILTLTPPPKM